MVGTKRMSERATDRQIPYVFSALYITVYIGLNLTTMKIIKPRIIYKLCYSKKKLNFVFIDGGSMCASKPVRV